MAAMPCGYRRPGVQIRQFGRQPNCPANDPATIPNAGTRAHAPRRQITVCGLLNRLLRTGARSGQDAVSMLAQVLAD